VPLSGSAYFRLNTKGKRATKNNNKEEEGKEERGEGGGASDEQMQTSLRSLFKQSPPIFQWTREGRMALLNHSKKGRVKIKTVEVKQGIPPRGREKEHLARGDSSGLPESTNGRGFKPGGSTAGKRTSRR